MADEDMMRQEWAANSYEDGHLDVYGEKHSVVLDTRLRDAVAPYVLGASKDFSTVRRTLTVLAGRTRSALVRSQALAKGELVNAERELEQMTRRLPRAERKNERMT